MSENSNFITYLRVSPKKLGIYLFDINNSEDLYRQEVEYDDEISDCDFIHLNNFLEDNIFKIEKLIGEFIKNLFLVIDSKKILNLKIGLKKKNYKGSVDKELLQNMLVDVKDLFQENYRDEKIMHMLINKYIYDDKSYNLFENNLFTDIFCIEVQFKSISNVFASQIEKSLQKYQITISKYLDCHYIQNYFKDRNYDFSKMSYKIQSGCNQNEVLLIPKSTKKRGFFEKFFQLFG